MADARQLGELTHQTETYLETSFIRNESDLKKVRKTLEHYLDSLDMAAKSYKARDSFVIPKSLLQELGVEQSQSTDDLPVASADSEYEHQDAVTAASDADKQSSEGLSEGLTEIADRFKLIQSEWKSARGWSKIQTKLSEPLESLSAYVSDNERELGDLSPVVDHCLLYTSPSPRDLSTSRMPSSA